MRLSNGVTVSMSINFDVTVFAVRSIPITSPSKTRMFFWSRRTSRVVAAMSPSDKIPVAT